MSPYNPIDDFTAGEIYDLSDLVKGGFNGDANVPIQGLYNRTLYLQKRLPKWEGILVKTDDYTFNVDTPDTRQWIVFQINANKAFTLPAVGLLDAGTRIVVSTIIAGLKALTVQTINNEQIIDGTIAWTKWDDPTQGAIYLHDAEKLILIAATDHWIVESAPPQLYTAGQSFGSRRPEHNTVFADGSVYNRADMPRVALYALSLPLGQSCVADSIWLSDPGGLPWFRGCYSTGNGSTTIRVPDERGLADRYLDQGRGLDLNRLWQFAGGYEPDATGPHTHALIVPPSATSVDQNGSGRFTGGGSATEPITMTPVFTNPNNGIGSGDQTIMKNIGKIPLIRY